jgi:hypothetical protein
MRDSPQAEGSRHFFSLPDSARTRKFVCMRKKLAAQLVLLVVFIFIFTGCASSPRQEIMTEQPDASSQGAGAVPGEKVSDDGRVTPGATGSNATVHW